MPLRSLAPYSYSLLPSWSAYAHWEDGGHSWFPNINWLLWVCECFALLMLFHLELWGISVLFGAAALVFLCVIFTFRGKSSADCSHCICRHPYLSRTWLSQLGNPKRKRTRLCSELPKWICLQKLSFLRIIRCRGTGPNILHYLCIIAGIVLLEVYYWHVFKIRGFLLEVFESSVMILLKCEGLQQLNLQYFDFLNLSWLFWLWQINNKARHFPKTQ